MSGGGSTQGQSYQATNSNTQATAPSAIEGVLKNLVGQRWQDFLNNPNAPAYFPGETVAAFSPQTESALTALYQRGANGSPVTGAANNTALSTLQGDFLDLSKNPYLQGAIYYAQQPVIDAFNNQILPGITSTFEGAGRTPQSGNLAGGAVGQATDALTRNLAGAATTAGANAYGQERANQLSTLGMVPQLQGLDYANLNAMLTAGGARDTKSQQLIDEAVNRYNYGQNAQGDYLTRIAQQLQTIYPGGATSGSGYTSGSYAQPGASSSPFGAILGGAGLALQAAPLLAGLSDRRDKTDIQELGVDPTTGLPMYAYRYKSDPKNTPKIFGPMAQDIEKVRPDLVVEIGGHKVVRGLI